MNENYTVTVKMSSAADPAPEYVTAMGGRDCYGNIGWVRTEQDTYAYNLYLPAGRQWQRVSTKTEGNLKLADNPTGESTIAFFTPAEMQS